MGLGMALVWRGLAIFCGGDLRPAFIAATPLLALGLAAYYAFVQPSLQARLLSSSILFALINLACVATLVRGVRDATRGVMWVGAAGFAALALALLARTALLLALDLDEPLRRALSGWTLIMTALAQVTISFGLILMVTRGYAEELRQASLTDGLTGALNRVGLEQMAPRMLRRAQMAGMSLALLMVDADHFKQINDRHGHPVGDEVLRRLVQQLRALLRPSDLIARYGGEEFVLLLADVDPPGAQAVAERLRAAVEQHGVTTGAGWLPLTVSIGVGLAAQVGYDLAELVRAADAAVYRAKAEGRNRVAVAPAPAPDLLSVP
jgi:diguanylate cyclase (GGDEF)-like protein